MVDNQDPSSLGRRTRAIKYGWMLSLSLLLIIPFVFYLNKIDTYANPMLFYQLLGYSALSIIISILSLVFIAPVFNILFDGVYRLLGVFNKKLSNPYNRELISTIWALFFMLAASPPVILFYLLLLGCFRDFPSIEFLEYLGNSDKNFNILIGLFGVISLTLLAWRSYAMDNRANIAEDQRQIEQKNLELSEKRRLDERFSKALDILSKNLTASSYASHVGAIAELSQLAIDSEEHTQGCINAICACNQWMDDYTEVFLRQHSSGIFSARKLSKGNSILSRPKTLNKSDKEKHDLELIQEKRSQEALRGVAHLLKSIGEGNDSKERLSNLSFYNKMLCGIDLGDARIDYINFRSAHLTAANLSKASLIGANLAGASLEGAYFRSSKLLAANLCHTKVMGASFMNADLSGANLYLSALQGVNMIRTNLQGANLKSANLLGANLRNTNLMGAILDKTKLGFCILLKCNLYGTIIKGSDYENIMYADMQAIKTIVGIKSRKIYLAEAVEFFNGSTKGLSTFQKNMQNAWRDFDKQIEPEKIKDFEEASLIEKKTKNSGSQEVNNTGWYFKKNSTPKIKGFLMKHVDDLFDISGATLDNKALWEKKYIRKYKIKRTGYSIIHLFQEYYFQEFKDTYPYLHQDIKKILDELNKEIKDNIKIKK